MPDLADRISRAAVAALDLAPFDDRFGRLSRQVLAGGATRFQRVTADDQAVHFVIPVGLAGQRIDYGALVLQDRQAGILWRDAMGLDHSVVVPREDAAATFSSLTLGGERWMRFDVEGPGERMAFLVPPVSDPLLARTLVDFFQARPGHHGAGGHVPEPDPEPDPVVRVRVPDPEPEPEPAPEPPDEADAATALLPVEDSRAAEAGAEAEQEAWEDTPTELHVLPEALVEPVLEPTQISTDSSPAPQDRFALTDAEVDAWDPGHREHPAPFELYRDESTAPVAGTGSTGAMPVQPAPAFGNPQPSWGQQPSQGWGQAPMSAAVRPVEPATVYAEPSGTSRTLVGFLLGLFGTLAVGGAVIIARLLGMV